MATLLNPVSYYRASRWLYLHKVPVLPRAIKVFCELLFHCELPYTAKIGSGFEVAYRGFGIVVHHRAEIGRNVVLSPCVTIGGRSGKYDVPKIGDGVFVASGARILGDITIGDGAVIGANAVVIRSVPARSIAAGVPARIIRKNINAYDYTGWPQTPQSADAHEPWRPGNTSPTQETPHLFLFIQSLELGGSEKQCVELARQLSMNGFAVTVGCLRGTGPLKARVEEAGLPLVEFPVKSLLRLNTLVQMVRLIRFMRKNKFQVVHTNDLYSNLFAVPAARLAQIPVILSCQRDLSQWWWYTPVKRKILRTIQQLATWTLVNSEAIREDLIARDNMDPRRIPVVYNGVDSETFAPRMSEREQLFPEVPASDKLIIMVANMHLAVKGHSDLIAAAKIVCERNPEARFLLVGDGEMRTVFEDQVRSTQLEKSILFLGNRSDIPSLLSCCDIAVLASTSEGLPNAILEYMAAGLPTVATTVGGIPEIIEHERSGLLIPPRDPAALAEAILRLLNDDNIRSRLARGGRERVLAKFSFAATVEHLKRLYAGPSFPPALSTDLDQTLPVE